MKNQIKALKVKIKSLAEEARIIRLEERKALSGGEKYRDEKLYLSLREHRIRDVRSEQRHALLAYAFLRGRRYDATERSRRDISYSRFRDLVEKFGGLPGFKAKCELTELHQWVAAKPVEVQQQA